MGIVTVGAVQDDPPASPTFQALSVHPRGPGSGLGGVTLGAELVGMVHAYGPPVLETKPLHRVRHMTGGAGGPGGRWMDRLDVPMGIFDPLAHGHRPLMTGRAGILGHRRTGGSGREGEGPRPDPGIQVRRPPRRAQCGLEGLSARPRPSFHGVGRQGHEALGAGRLGNIGGCGVGPDRVVADGREDPRRDPRRGQLLARLRFPVPASDGSDEEEAHHGPGEGDAPHGWAPPSSGRVNTSASTCRSSATVGTWQARQSALSGWVVRISRTAQGPP
jgi:hypothetical protein